MRLRPEVNASFSRAAHQIRQLAALSVAIVFVLGVVTTARQTDADDYLATVQAARTALKEKRAEDALRLADSAISRAQKRWEAYAVKGTALLELSRFLDAVAAVDQAIALAPPKAIDALNEIRRSANARSSGGAGSARTALATMRPTLVRSVSDILHQYRLRCSFVSIGTVVCPNKNPSRLELVDVETGSVKGEVGKGGFYYHTVAAAPRVSRVATWGWADNNNIIQVFDVGTGKEVRKINLPKDCCDIGAGTDGPDDAHLAISGDGTLTAFARGLTGYLYEVASGKLRAMLQHSDRISALAFSPDSSVLASGGADHVIALVDTRLGRPKTRLQGHADVVTGMAWAKGRLVAIDNFGRVNGWNVETGTLDYSEKKLPGGFPAYSIDVNEDGTDALVSMSDGVVLFDPRNGEAVAQWLSSEGCKHVDWSPDQTSAVSFCYNNGGRYALWLARLK